MGTGLDLAGRKFDRLTVLSRAGSNKFKQSLWLCACTCGVEKIIPGSCLTRGSSRSCGCLQKDTIRQRSTTHGQSQRTDEYGTWASMVARCTNPNSEDYPDYGFRGIRVCECWLDFESFFADMGKKPTKKHSIDRIDNDRNYEPGNCRWATGAQQSRNNSRNRWLEFNGERKCLTDWAKDLGMSVSWLHECIGKGKTLGQILKSRKRI